MPIYQNISAKYLVELGAKYVRQVPTGLDTDITLTQQQINDYFLKEVKDREKAQVQSAVANRREALEKVRNRAVLRMLKGLPALPAQIAKLEREEVLLDIEYTAIADIDAATTKAEANAVFPAIVWPA